MLKAILAKLRLRRSASRPRIVLDTGGFVVTVDDHPRASVRWADVVAVYAYKYDHYAVDEVVVAIRQRPDPELVLEVSEDWLGFADLFAPFQRELGISDAWYRESTGRPFANDFRVLLDLRESPDSLGSAG